MIIFGTLPPLHKLYTLAWRTRRIFHQGNIRKPHLSWLLTSVGLWIFFAWSWLLLLCIHSSRPRHSRLSLLCCSAPFMPSASLTDPSDGNTSIWFPRRLLMRRTILGVTLSSSRRLITVSRLKSYPFAISLPYFSAPPVSPPHFLPPPPPLPLTQSLISGTLRLFIRLL